MHASNQHRRRVRRLPALLALVLPWALAAGCSQGVKESGLVPVSGRVTLDGGPWPQEGVITFGPVFGGGEDTSTGAFRPVSASFGTDGKFTVMSFDNSPGLYPGTYKVGVECWEEPPGMGPKGKPTPGKSPVPQKYRSSTTSGLLLQVDAGSTPDANFDVKSK